MSVTALEREVYGLGQAARLLRIPPTTQRRWLDGYERGGAHYPPVIRREPTGSDRVTWGEFVEAGYLHQYRELAVPLQRMRPVITRLRDELDTPYPLQGLDTAGRLRRLALPAVHGPQPTR